MKSGKFRKLVFICLVLALNPICYAKVFYSKNEAMELAFGKAEVELLSLFPDQDQVDKIQQLAHITLDSSFISLYVGKEQGKIIGYAAIETNTVRTKPETLLIVLSPDGQLRNIVTLAFHEPPEYMPPEHWYKQLFQRPLADMEFNKGVDGISGATLSTRSALNSVRKVLSIYEILIKNQGQH